MGRVTSFWAPLVPAAPRNSTALSARYGLFWAIRRRVASLFGDFRTGGSHKACRGLGELTPDVRSVLARRGRVETARPRTCCIVLKRYPWSRTAARRRRTHTDGRSRTSPTCIDWVRPWEPSPQWGSRGPNRHRCGRPRYLEIFELESRKHHYALWWSRRTALAAFGDFFFWASGHGLEAIRGAYSVNPRASPPPSRADGVIDQYEYITLRLGET